MNSTIQIPAVDTNAQITLTSRRGEHTAAVTLNGHREKTFTSRAAALAWIRSLVGRISLARAC